jgi:hypothetical protein
MVDGGCILALDIAKRTGVARGIAGGTPILSTENFSRPGDDDADVFGRFTMWVARVLRDDPPELIAVERPLPRFESSMLFGLRGIVLGLARCKSVRVLQVPVSTWRKYFLGAGNLKGPVAKQRCIENCERLGWIVPLVRGVPDHNSAEAAGIFSWAESKVAPKVAQRVEPLFLGGAT